MFSQLVTLLVGTLCLSKAGAFDYNISSAGDLFLVDESTGISGITTLFTGEVVLVSVEGVAWEPSGVEGGEEFVIYQTLLNGQVVDEGNISLVGVDRQLPSSLECGSVQTDRCK
jgi:hypothetical protein